MPDICNHGFWLTDCALCLKRLGECDFGSCTAPATARVDTRPLCARHAAAYVRAGSPLTDYTPGADA